ncbi:hypothetical protein [Mesorhizobium sp. 131-2-1]|uniref:hypothetical protein n=1 Tax=Mesorhizobium sp. 131-2-1 TaxID=2744518 RepID=UPI001927BE83|nr:hypothetical protein [Mesorhizobium sp. 131-2-1]BCG97927.1 hypothetical protein MesoLj131a_67910 [Mesorhizobium sp. 131-2-1]
MPDLSTQLPKAARRKALAIEAALLGQPISIAVRPLVEHDPPQSVGPAFDFDCDANKLVALFYPEAAEIRSAIRAFCDWIPDRIKAERS